MDAAGHSVSSDRMPSLGMHIPSAFFRKQKHEYPCVEIVFDYARICLSVRSMDLPDFIYLNVVVQFGLKNLPT